MGVIKLTNEESVQAPDEGLSIYSQAGVLSSINSDELVSRFISTGNLKIYKNSGAISTDTTSTSYVDIPNATVTVTLTGTSSLFILCSANITSAAGATMTTKALLNAASLTEIIATIGAGIIMPYSYIYLRTSLAAGEYVIKMQFKTGGNQVNFYNGMLGVLVVPQ